MRLRRRRTGSLTAWTLFALPLLLALAFFAVNLQLINASKSGQEAMTDASALAAAQTIVDDEMLAGDAISIDDLERRAAVLAQRYADLNRLNPKPVIYADSDVTFTTLANPYDGTRSLVESVTVTARRTDANDNSSVPLVARGLFTLRSVDIVTASKGLLDRQVAGLRPVFLNNLPLAPIALLQSDWSTQIETAYDPSNIYTVILDDPSKAAFLAIGTSSEAELIDQLANGVNPAQLNNAPYTGAFLLDSSAGLTTPTLAGVTPTDLQPVLQSLIDNRVQRVWPLFNVAGGGSATVVRLMAARVTSATVTKVNPMGPDVLRVTLQPTFLSSPAVVTEPVRPTNLYVCRVHLSN
jgi:hypothetical protein